MTATTLPLTLEPTLAPTLAPIGASVRATAPNRLVRRPRPAAPPRAAAAVRRPVRPVTAPTTKPSRAVYRRRRVVTAAIAGLFVLAGARAADGVVAGTAGPVHPSGRVVHYQVQPGDTLWSIAGRLAPHDDPREVVDMLAQAHGSATIQPGDVIDWAGT